MLSNWVWNKIRIEVRYGNIAICAFGVHLSRRLLSNWVWSMLSNWVWNKTRIKVRLHRYICLGGYLSGRLLSNLGVGQDTS